MQSVAFITTDTRLLLQFFPNTGHQNYMQQLWSPSRTMMILSPELNPAGQLPEHPFCDGRQ